MSADAVQWLFEATGLMSAALILVLLLRTPLRRGFGARAAYALWLLVPLALLVTLLPAPERNLVPMRVAPVIVPADVTATASGSAALAWPGLLLAAWLAGVLLLVIDAWRAQRRYRRALGVLRQRDDGCLQSEGVRAGPAVFGLLRPRIVLPADFEQRYDHDERELVLAHERVHLRRGDLWINLAALALRGLQWFNPLMIYAAPRFRVDQEFAVDAAVLARRPSHIRRYAEAMLKTQLGYATSPLGCHWQTLHPLKERIMMLSSPLPTLRRSTLGAVIVASLASGFGFAAWAAQPVPKALDNPAEPATYNAIQPPRYPKTAIDAKAGGDVMLRVLVDRSGTPEQVEVESSTGNAELDASAIAAVRKWKFNPARDGDAAVPSWVLVPINFSLSDSSEPAAPAMPDERALDTIRIRGG